MADKTPTYSEQVDADAARLKTLEYTDELRLPTRPEAERLVKLAEECSEVAQMCMKILRHGYESHHPDDPDTDNRALLNEELTDLSAVLLDMRRKGDIPALNVIAVQERVESKRRYDHFQG